MFGVFRYALAWLVVMKHLWLHNWMGSYAVFSFYCLSGFLMTLVLSRTYAASLRGAGRFAGNRALRIFPGYFAAAALGLAAVLLFPDVSHRMSSTLRLPANPTQWLHNLVIVGNTIDQPGRLVPPSWSLHVELIFYALMATGIVRSRLLAGLWFAGSVGYTIHLVAGDAHRSLRYFPVAAASLPFSAGVLLYHAREKLTPYLKPWHAVAFVTAFAANGLFADRLWSDVWTGGFYASLLLAGGTILSLSALDRSRAPSWFARLDSHLGDLAYPIFLCHWSVGVLVAALARGGDPRRDATLFLLSAPLVHVTAWGIHRAVERPIGRVRDRVRGGT